MARAWMIRAGSQGEREEAALKEGLVIAGWEEVEDLTHVATREDLRQLLAKVYPELSPQVIANWTGQLWRFRQEITIGDLVAMPLAGRRLALGRITGPYHYRPDAESGLRHTRPVEWNPQHLDRDTVRPDLRDSMGSLLTIFELRRYDAAQRIATLAEQGFDPGPQDTLEQDTLIASPQRLEELAQAASGRGDTLTLTVRQLLAIWGHTRRWPSVVEQLRTDLDDLGLSTSPPFDEENLNSTVSILPVGAEPNSGVTVPTAAELPAESSPENRPVALLVKQLPSATTKMTWVTPGDHLHSATTKMGLNSFSQLPVLDEERRLRGVVTWESIGMAYLSNPSPTLAQVTMPQTREAHGDDDLLDWIPEIYQRGFVFVRDAERRITGIITTADLTNQLGSQLRPFLLIAEIERRLRRIVGRLLREERITIGQVRDQLRGNRRKRVSEPKDLTIGEYPYVFEPEQTWRALNWSVDRGLFLARLREAAQFRNNLMHLNPDLDPEADDELLPLRGLLSMLRSLDRDE